MPQIDWENPVAVWAAVARRRAVRHDGKGLGGINIATFLWTDGTVTKATTRWSESPLGTGADFVLHSEEMIWGEIEKACKTIYWVFTERAPCPPHPVGRGCREWLPKVLKKVGVKGSDTPIYWIYPYPDNTGLDFEDVQHDLVKLLPEGKLLNQEWAKRASRHIREGSAVDLQNVDGGIETAYTEHGTTKKNYIKKQIHGLKEQFAQQYAGAIPDMP